MTIFRSALAGLVPFVLVLVFMHRGPEPTTPAKASPAEDHPSHRADREKLPSMSRPFEVQVADFVPRPQQAPPPEQVYPLPVIERSPAAPPRLKAPERPAENSCARRHMKRVYYQHHYWCRK